MATSPEREHFIPIRRHELIDLLCDDKGMPAADREGFRLFCRLLMATFNFQYHHHLETLKHAYAPFDPDSDCHSMAKHRAEDRQRKLSDLFSEFGWLMERADFRHLSTDGITPALGSATPWGLVMDVDFKIFERLAVFARGDGVEKRRKRKWWRPWEYEEVEVPIYRRLAMILKLKPNRRMDSRVNIEAVYLQLFKNIPKQDILMLLPGARARMSRIDRGKVGLPFLSGLAMAAYQVADDILLALARYSSQPTLLLWGLATGAIGYGSKSYFSYIGTRQRYNLNLTQVLYFQNLDTNVGVLLRIIEEAEEQECRAAMLAYHALWRHGGESGWTSPNLETHVEKQLEELAQLRIEFKVRAALSRLERMRLVEAVEDRYRAVPLPRVLELLDETWHDCWKPKAAAPTGVHSAHQTMSV